MRCRQLNHSAVSFILRPEHLPLALTLQSIILRAFQGMGASGIYSMVLVLAPTLVPKKEYGKYIGIISSVFAIASVLGPILGGVIATNTTWRWVFWLK